MAAEQGITERLEERGLEPMDPSAAAQMAARLMNNSEHTGEVLLTSNLGDFQLNTSPNAWTIAFLSSHTTNRRKSNAATAPPGCSITLLMEPQYCPV